MYSFLYINNLSSHNDVKNSLNRTLDLVLSNFTSVVVKEGVSLTEQVDKYHPPLTINLILNKIIRKDKGASRVDRNKFNFQKANSVALYESFQKKDWSEFYHIYDSNLAAEYFQNSILEIVGSAVPLKKPVSNRTYPCWFNHSVIKELKKKALLHKRWKKMPNDLVARQRFVDKRREVRALLRKARGNIKRI